MEQHYKPEVEEPKLRTLWEKEKVFSFNPNDRRPIFSIDTPPPYASADHLHIGHAMHYSQFEFVARYKRMRGYNVFFPMGFDDNGLPTERFVEKKYKINKAKITRAEFIKLCRDEVKTVGATYKKLWSDIGLSVDWDLLYTTIDPRCTKISQLSFLDLYKKGHLVRMEEPVTWCMKCQTAIAQADFENIELDSHMNTILFHSGAQELAIATTRPELIPACVALFVHPDDTRYKDLHRTFATVPLTNHEVPILCDEAVDKELGTGLMMCCTFGDKEDIEKWRVHNLALRIVFTPYGKLNELAGPYKGLSIKEARKQILLDLEEKKLLLDKKPLRHAVNVHERCSTEIEFLKTPQWIIKVLDKKEELLEAADKIKWYPEHMKVRYNHWVQNLHWDWLISRQRFYGVPFPVWYCEKCSLVKVAEQKDLPVDPMSDFPSSPCECGSKTFLPEEDVMDTWMTSSLTPLISAKWGEEKNFMDQIYPASLRPQGHDIIRTWAFYTIIKSYLHHNSIPWKDIMISGHGLDPRGQKMSKSKGNVVLVDAVIKKYSTDALRFWAASAKLGDDLAYHEKDVVTGQKTVKKLWNAARFVFSVYSNAPPSTISLTPIDKWLLTKLSSVISIATASFDKYEYSKCKAETEKFFWNVFCDYYLEIVKDRMYNPRSEENTASAHYTLHTVLLTVLKLFAPIMPYVTDAIYQEFPKKEAKSIHASAWPLCDESWTDTAKAGDLAIEIIGAVRKYKSEQKFSLGKEIQKICIVLEDPTMKSSLAPFADDIRATCRARELLFEGKADKQFDQFRIGVTE